MSHEHAKGDQEERQDILDNIEQYGCHLALLEPDNYLPGFAYSIGLFKRFAHPEIICFGLTTEVMSSVLNHACELIKKGETLVAGKLYPGFLDGYDVQFIEVDKSYYPDYVGYAGWFYDNSFDFPLLQLVWPDKASHFPWENDFNAEWKFIQPLLDRNTDFKFYEERNLGVYTTKQVLAGEPVLYVYHDADGDWQFHAVAEPDMNDAKLVCLEELVKMDTSINEIFHLQLGWRAWRDTKEDDWQYDEDGEEEME
ncbi:protein of unknown function [Filimonas lacunae]|uniref:DUF4262 domain-containing protein n=1 Tax=Filimonas lacunae TaxID=477680 RepID=A0A173ML50_9BACT|nr:DUF4262 domain-containing protein [Filimonas lacunae]BAV08334.1 hypothetical protein FLA_4370 [Filimonas lacunae]SIT33398.1 protein of unknown function [Filimonas lacunae]